MSCYFVRQVSANAQTTKLGMPRWGQDRSPLTGIKGLSHVVNKRADVANADADLIAGGQRELV